MRRRVTESLGKLDISRRPVIKDGVSCGAVYFAKGDGASGYLFVERNPELSGMYGVKDLMGSGRALVCISGTEMDSRKGLFTIRDTSSSVSPYAESSMVGLVSGSSSSSDKGSGKSDDVGLMFLSVMTFRGIGEVEKHRTKNGIRGVVYGIKLIIVSSARDVFVRDN